MAHSRRAFLKSAGLATAAVSAGPLALGLPGTRGRGSATAAPPPDAYAGGHFALELDGQAVGSLAAVQGGNVVAEVIEYTSGNDLIAQKSPGGLRYEEISMMTGLGMAPVLWDWVGHMLDGTPVAMDGAIVFADADFNVRRRMEFRDALLTEVKLPALDASNKDAAYMTIKLRPEATVLTPPSGKLANASATKQKLWQVSNFRLKVGDLPCGRVQKIDSLTIKQKITEYREGTERFPRLLPGKLEVPNLGVTFSAMDAGPWQAHFDDFILNENNQEEDELGGTIEYLSPNLKTALATLEFFHLGIFRLAPEEFDPSATNVQRFRADLYSEGNRLFVGGLN